MGTKNRKYFVQFFTVDVRSMHEVTDPHDSHLGPFWLRVVNLFSLVSANVGDLRRLSYTIKPE
jgi:hypothetical protein